MRWWLILFLVGGFGVVGQETEPGRDVRQVQVRDHPDQSYAMFLPSTYTTGRRWPILYCLDPVARGRVPVERFAAAAEKAGFLVAGSNNSRNGPPGPAAEAINLMIADTHERFAVDDARIYAAGFSGGARSALEWGRNGYLAGVAACGAGYDELNLPVRIPFRLWAASGRDDFNHDEMYRMSRAFDRRGVAHRFVEFEGGHDWAPASLADDMFGYFLGTLPARPAQTSKEADREAAQCDRRIAELVAATTTGERRALIQGARKEAARPEDSADRRVARRFVGGVYVGAVEQTRDLMTRRRYEDAARTIEDATMARPEVPGPWYTLAVAQAASGDTRAALEALRQAAAAGFRSWQEMESEPLLAKLRRDRHYPAILAAVRQQ